MRIEIDDNSAALTPFGSLVSGAVRSKSDGKPWTSAFQVDRPTLPAALLTFAIIAIISIGLAKSSLGTTYRVILSPVTVNSGAAVY
jgi:hypothetical protein